MFEKFLKFKESYRFKYKRQFIKGSILILSIIFMSSCEKETTNMGNNQYKLLWADEFEGDTINFQNWSFQAEPAGRFNNEWQEFTNSKENAYVEDGKLVIEAKYNGQDLESGNFSSARLITHGKRDFKYGKVSARIKVPTGQGVWPAFWMLGSNISENNGGSVDWPKCGEIDIMEKIGGGENEKTLHGTIHYWKDSFSKWEYIGGKTVFSQNLSEDYHIYEIQWNEAEIIWSLDGKEYHRQNIEGSDFHEFRNNFYILLNVAVGGDWPQYPDENTVFPQKMLVDWVRVYQK